MADFISDDAEAVSSPPTLVSSWGGGTSNVYVSYTAANSFITNGILDNTAWDDASSTERSAALMEACRDLDSRTYIYGRFNNIQCLEFPRSLTSNWWDAPAGTWDAANLSTLQTRMQADVEKANCHQALYILQKSSRSEHTDLIQAGVTSAKRKVGPIEEEYRYGSAGAGGVVPGTVRRPICKEALDYLSDWMSSRKILRG